MGSDICKECSEPHRVTLVGPENARVAVAADRICIAFDRNRSERIRLSIGVGRNVFGITLVITACVRVHSDMFSLCPGILEVRVVVGNSRIGSGGAEAATACCCAVVRVK
ncbi:50S ribosomal protein L18, partial [Frankliniella fusca]